MGDTTAISWADHTFNPWEGCTRISPACDNCYAADRAHRFGNDHLWAGKLRRTSPANWRKPLAWNRAAEAAGVKARIFCASLADVFDNRAPQEWREDLWRLIEATPNLIWMLLTKRPQNVSKMTQRWWTRGFLPKRPPANVWLGTTAEDQARADQRLPILIRDAVNLLWLPFVSAEPLLGPLDLSRWLRSLGLVIAGGESGPKARPSHPDWFRSLRDQCAAASVPFHFKQWGEWTEGDKRVAAMGTVVLHLGQPQHLAWPDGTITNSGRAEDHSGPATWLRRVGTAQAGRKLDGVEHLAMPRGIAT